MTIEERNKIVEKNMPLVVAIVSRRIRPHPQQWEDYIQVGVLALILASERFDPSKGAFSTFAGRYILNSCQTYRRQTTLVHYTRDAWSQRLSTNTDIDNKLFQWYGSLADLPPDVIPDANSHELQEAEFKIVICQFIDYLQSLARVPRTHVHQRTQQRNTEMYIDYLQSCLENEPLTQQELANKYGISQSLASRILKQYNEKLRTFLDVR